MTRSAPALALALALAVAGCAGSSSAPDAAAPDLAPLPPGDSLPTNAIAFFHALACPQGWSAYGRAAGRFVVPTPGTGGIADGGVVGAPLAAGDDPAHAHAIDESVTLPSTSFAGVTGCCNNGPAAAGTVGFSVTSATASTNLPYVTLLVCKKSAPPESSALPLPPGMMLFFDADACPDGFSQTAATEGRHLVALPDGGTPGATFGGPPLARGEDRGHSHAVSGALTTTASGVALASGCCGGGYAQSGSYPFAAPTANASSGLPYVHLLQCTKN
ncbi:MAG TPA: hypothetical protein VFF06_16635 [Polyangia bacterium]|nr:hypothetical protein [Polyangia bacterium]